MTLYKFDEVLNDLMDYFILGDSEYLLQYKNGHNLPDDLLTEFTTQETGHVAVEQGVLIPMTGIENCPYTIYFNLTTDEPELLKSGNELQHRQAGYCLNVKNGRIYLYTIPYLRDFTPSKIELLKRNKHATIELANGWYAVSILGGLTKQRTEIINQNNEPNMIETMEPTFEFLISHSEEKPVYTADFSHRFKIEE